MNGKRQRESRDYVLRVAQYLDNFGMWIPRNVVRNKDDGFYMEGVERGKDLRRDRLRRSRKSGGEWTLEKSFRKK